MRLLFELILLSVLYLIGYFITDYYHLSTPPAFVGMGILFILLTAKIVPYSFFQKSSSFLNRHVLLFLLPIMVGLMEYGTVLKVYGVQFILIIMVSTMVAIAVTALFMEIKHDKRRN